MVRVFYGANAETTHLYLRAVQDEIQLAPGRNAWKGGQTVHIGVLEIRGLQEQLKFIVPPKYIEITRDNQGFIYRFEKMQQVAQLVLTVPEFERQMHQKDNESIELEFDDQFLDARFEKMKLPRHDSLVGDERISLALQHRHAPDQGVFAVLARVYMGVTEFLRNPLRLVDLP